MVQLPGTVKVGNGPCYRGGGSQRRWGHGCSYRHSMPRVFLAVPLSLALPNVSDRPRLGFAAEALEGRDHAVHSWGGWVCLGQGWQHLPWPVCSQKRDEG